ncbi:MAG: tyrosinase family protein [Burkholderiaceae bacterium]
MTASSTGRQPFKRSIGAAAAAAAMSVGALIWPSLSQAAPAVRLSWQDFAQDPKNVESLRKAVAVMKARNAAPQTSPEFRKSWTYWANMHGYFGPQSPFGTLAANEQRVSAKDLKYFKGIADATPPDQVATDVWAQCQHGTPWFFAWHRLYLYYFEKQLQEASGNPDLHLPYWDYTNPSQLKMPAEFTKPTYVDGTGKKQGNPLYESRRAPGWQTGKQSLNTNSTNIDSALMKQKTFTGYQDAIENNVHGYIHCTVAVTCPVTDMGSVPYSSNDPIFWVHHANIDRMWSCWTNLQGNSNPTDPTFLNKQFAFINADGQEVTNKVSDLFGGGLIDYKYEQEVNCARTASTHLAAEEQNMTNRAGQAPMAAGSARNPPGSARLLNAPTKPLLLTKSKNSLHVDFVQAEEQKPLQGLASSGNAAVRTETVLTLRDISFKAHPGTMFNVYLQSAGDPKKKLQVGTLSFFTVPPGVGGHHGDAAHQHPSTGLTREFDVTDALRSLDGGSRKGVTVSFEATTGREGDQDVPAVNEAAQLTVGGIDFQVRPPQ